MSVLILLTGLFYFFSCSRSPESCIKKFKDETESSYHPNLLVLYAASGDLHLVDLLLCAGADPNVINNVFPCNTPLSAAARNGHPIVIKKLLSKGADVNYQNKDGKTALDFAIENSVKPNIIKLLKEAGAKKGN